MIVPDARGSNFTRVAWWPVLFFSFAIAGYALSYHVRGTSAFPPDLRDSFTARPWGIYTHVVFGAAALLLGPFQFRRQLLLRHRRLHRVMGRMYVVSAFATGVVGLYMSLFSFGGPTTHLGFGILGALTAGATIKAYTNIRALDVAGHRQWMIRSFALIFAAVTLRLELPLLIAYYGKLRPAYLVVSWLSWVPNLLWAEWYMRRSGHRRGASLPVHSRAPQGLPAPS